MTKQLYSLPNLDTKSRQNFLALSKYSATKKKLRKGGGGQFSVQQQQQEEEEEGDVAFTQRTMNSNQITDTDVDKSRQAAAAVPFRTRREDSRLAEPGDNDMSIQTPRLNHEDRTRSEPSILPPIEALVQPSDVEEGNGGEGAQSKNSFKLPVASRYQLYSIGLTYNSDKGKKERRTKKKPQTYREINSRRNKLKSNRDEKPDPPMPSKAPEEENFSIRKKIEQYRNWHEEQYRQKIKDLKSDTERERQAEILKIASLKNKTVKKPSSMKMSHRSNSYDHILPRLPAKNDHNFNSVLKEEDEDDISEKDVDKNAPEKGANEEKENENKNGDVTDTERVSSSKTWRTWRDVNDSYAYTDVKQYIKENELMDEEKEKYINEWIDQVSCPTDDAVSTVTFEETASYSNRSQLTLPSHER